MLFSYKNRNPYQFFFPAFEVYKSVKFHFRLGTWKKKSENLYITAQDGGLGIEGLWRQYRNDSLAIEDEDLIEQILKIILAYTL